MLFNKKMLVGLCNVIGVLIVANFVLNIVMYVWAFYGEPPLAMFNVTNTYVAYYNLVYQLSSMVFMYVTIGMVCGLIKSSKLQEGFKK